MATVKKSKKKVIVPIIIVLVIAVAVVSIIAVNQSKKGVDVSLYTIATDDIYEKVSLTGEVMAGSRKEYKVGTVGTVKEVFVKLGDTVKKGDVLATFDLTELNSQVSALQESYNETLTSYNSAVKTQEEAKKKVKALDKSIAAAEKKLAKLQNKKATATTTTAKATTKKADKSATASVAANSIIPTDITITRPETTAPITADFTGLSDALIELNKTLVQITDDLETLTTATQIIADVISSAAGNLDNETIANMIFESLVDSGIAEEMAKQIVEAIDIDAIAKTIVEADDSQIAAAEIELVSLQAQRAIFAVQADGSVVSAQKKSLRATKEALDTLKKQQEEMSAGWVAAFDGTITAVDVEPGVQTTLLNSGITLENLDSVCVKISLGEYDLHKVKVGMTATIKTAYGLYDGEVTSIAPTATGGSSSSILDNVGSMAGISGLSSLTESGAGVECIVSIPDADENITVGFDADVTIQTGEFIGVTVVPIESIKLEKTGTYVYLYDAEEGTVTKTQIETGAVSDAAYQVKSGLNVGDQIISAPASDYEDDTFKVKVVTK